MPQQQGSSMSETKSNQRFHSLNAEQVEVLHQVLSEAVPIHGRGNFPTLELRPRDIIIAVRARLQQQGIAVRDVRLNGSTASHVLVRDNGTSYKDLDIIFGVELPSQEEFQVIKESVLGCLLDCLPAGVNRERISSATMKEAYVQKMVKVFNEHDRWSLISLSNNSGKNLELKFVSTLRRQFEFSVDSFQIILDRLLESYMQQESQHKHGAVDLMGRPAGNPNRDSSPSLLKQAAAPEKPSGRDSSNKEGARIGQTQQRDEEPEKESPTEETEHSSQTKRSEVEKDNQVKTPVELKDASGHEETCREGGVSGLTSADLLPEETQTSENAEPPSQIQLRHEPELSDETERSAKVEEPERSQPRGDPQAAHSDHKPPLSVKEEQSNRTKPPDGRRVLGEETQPETSNETQTESLTLPEERRSADSSDGEDQRSEEEDEPRRVTAGADSGASPQAEAETQTQTADESKAETGVGERAETERSETTEERLASEAKHVEDTLGVRCCCSTSSVSLALHDAEPAGTQDTPETLGTSRADEAADALDAAGPPDAQDISPAPPGLVSDKNTSSSSSSSSPSCKASERLSHMVVLKHASPKPPRRMCRKVSPTPSPVSESETSLDPNPCPSPEPEIGLNPKPTAASSDPATTPTAGTASDANPGSEPTPPCNLDLSSAPDPAPDVTSTCAVAPASGLSREPSPPRPITSSLHSLDETASPRAARGERSRASPSETQPAPEQSRPLDSADASGSGPRAPASASGVELRDAEEDGEPGSGAVDLNPPNGSPEETGPSSPSPPRCAGAPLSCLAPPALSLSPPRFTPSPPSLSPPPRLTSPSHCLSSPPLNTVSPASSGSSPPLSFSPTSSCLSSPPYLTPPMLSLSPPPLCLSPPLLCLTPPVESQDLAPQVSSDVEPSIANTGSEEQMEESSPQPGTPQLKSEDQKEEDRISLSPQVAQPVSFPITIPSSGAHALPPPQPEGGPGETTPPKADEASGSGPEKNNKEAPEVTAAVPEQSFAPQASGSVPPAVEVLAESMYGDFEAAMDHLRYRLIATRNPEEIRGGGLLKYSNLLVRDYRPASETQIKTLERYMCSRFFIDFSDVQEQQRKILSYLKNHFIGEERSKYQYLMTLRRVVDDSTVCLMGHERRQTLNMITVLALKVLGEQNIIPNTDHVTCFYQPASYLADHSAPYLAEPSYCSYYIPQGGSTLLYQPYPLHLHTQTGLV